MKHYKRNMLGSKSLYAQECYEGNFIGADFGIRQNLSKDLPENWREFNKKFSQIWLAFHPDKSKVSAGLACGMFWTICKGIRKGVNILNENGQASVEEIITNLLDKEDYSEAKINQRSVERMQKAF